MNGATVLRPGDRVLVTRLNYLGDVVLSLPLVDALHRAVPGLEIDYLAREPGSALLAGDSRFSQVHTLYPGARRALSLISTLRRRRYRAVMDLYSNPRSAWLSWFTGAPIRIGGNRRGRRRLYTHPVSVAPRTPVHDVFMAYARPLGITAAAGCPHLAVADAESSQAEATLAAAGATGTTRIGIHPGGKWPVKRWPAGKFAELAQSARAQFDADIVLFSGPGESDATDAVRRLVGGSVHVLPELPIRHAAAVASRLDAMVACDGGMMHVSVAVGTPTVGIFGSAESALWFPYRPFGPHRAAEIPVPCRPCHQHECPLGTTACLNDLGAEAVVAHLADVIGASRRARGQS